MSVGRLTGARPFGASRGRPAPGAVALRRPRAAVAGVAALTVLGALLRFYAIGRQGYWYDEADTILLIRRPAGAMLGLLPHTESTPPLYYIAAWVWSRVFGDGEAAVRSLSAVAGAAVIPVAYGAAARLISRPAGLITAALTACSPLLIWYSQEARAYELLVLLTAVSLLACVHARRDRRLGWLALWALSAALALTTHYYAVVAVVPEAVWLLIGRRDRAAVLAVALVGICGLALIPLAVAQNRTGNDSWIAHSPLRLRLAQIVPQLLIGTGAPLRQLLKFAAMACAALSLALLALRATAAQRRGPLAAGGLALGGFALALALAVAGSDDVITRNLIALWLPAAMLIAGGLALPAARRLGAGAAVALCLIGVVATLAVARDRDLQRPDWRPVARALQAERTPGARALLVQHYQHLLPLSLYLPGLAVMHRPARVTELDVISISSPSQPLCWWGAACNLIPSRMQARYEIPGLRSVARTRVRQFTILRLVADRPVPISRGEVAAALHATTLRRDELLYLPG